MSTFILGWSSDFESTDMSTGKLTHGDLALPKPPTPLLRPERLQNISLLRKYISSISSSQNKLSFVMYYIPLSRGDLKLTT